MTFRSTRLGTCEASTKMPPWMVCPATMTFWQQRELRLSQSIQMPAPCRVSAIRLRRIRHRTLQWVLMAAVS